MLKSVKFLQEYRSLPAGLEVEFRPGVNLVVGDQGCGKSSLIHSVDEARRTKELKSSRVELDCDGTTAFQSWDFERDNPRTAAYFNDSKAPKAQFNSIWASHGQSMHMILGELLGSCKTPTTLLLDEPDMALSIRSIRSVVRAFDIMTARGHQIIAACHNAMLIVSYAQVYSLEHKRWLKPSQFIDNHWKEVEVS